MIIFTMSFICESCFPCEMWSVWIFFFLLSFGRATALYLFMCINRNTDTSIIFLCRVICFVFVWLVVFLNICTVLVMHNLNQEVSFLGTQFPTVLGSISEKSLYASWGWLVWLSDFFVCLFVCLFCFCFLKKVESDFYTSNYVYALEQICNARQKEKSTHFKIIFSWSEYINPWNK